MALKKFNDGEVFYSDDMDALVAGSHMRFASAAARDAALVGGLAPANGMLATLADQNLAYRYNGVMNPKKWMPTPGTVLFAYGNTNAQALAGNTTNYLITNWNVNLLGTRNLNNWFNPTTGRFAPDLAGFYEIAGGICFSQAGSSYAYYRALEIFYGNDATGAMCLQQGSMWQAPYTQADMYLHILGTFYYQPSGNAYAALSVNNTYTSALNVNPAGQPGYFSVKYLGS